jgi:glyoxylase-like metal-dependent hydrolase (beta-lactamase superfamily II)
MIHSIDLQFLGLRNTLCAYLVETSEGPVLVETGPHSTFAALEQGVRRLGFDLREGRHVFLTHIHLDHAGAAWALARWGARIHVHPAGAAHLIDPGNLLRSAERIYRGEMRALWGDLEPLDPGSVVPAGHGEAFRVGATEFVAWHTPGHAVHHALWQVGENLFTGDAGGVKIHRGPVIPPCPPPDLDVDRWRESLRLIRSLKPTQLFLTHFGAVAEVDAHLKELEERLMAWTGWIGPHVEAGATLETLVPLFRAFVDEESGLTVLTGEERQAYESASPAWMSAAGLMRYWRKKMGR